MTQKERQERSRREIRRAAMEEFGNRGYAAATMDGICVRGGISKGMIYHYYTGKDALFLLCVRDMFRSMAEHVSRAMEEETGEPESGRICIRRFFSLREAYFQEHPLEKTVFENTMLHPPKHLREDIRRLRGPVQDINRRFLGKALDGLSLREGIDRQKAYRYLESIERALFPLVEGYQGQEEIADIKALLALSEEMLDMLLFGIAGGHT